MDVQVLSDPRLFVKLAAGWLAVDPFSTNVIGVHTASVVGRPAARRPRRRLANASSLKSL